MLIRFALCFAVLLGGATRSPSPPRDHWQVSGRGYGVLITLTVLRQAYGPGTYIRSIVRVSNVSHHNVILDGYPTTCAAEGYRGSNPIVVVLDKKNRVVYPPPVTGVLPQCPNPRRVVIHPGHARARALLVPGGGTKLQANVLLVPPYFVKGSGDLVYVSTRPLGILRHL